MAGETTAALSESQHEYLTGPIEKLEHDINIERVTNEQFHCALEFIRACRHVGVWRLKQGKLSADAGWNIGQLADEIAHSICVLIEHDDVMLARRLPGIVDQLNGALRKYGRKMTGRTRKPDSIEQILKNHDPRGLLAMVSALHPDWDAITGIENRQEIEALPENKLRELLLSKECWTARPGCNETDEWRTHRLAQFIENIMPIWKGANSKIHTFVALLMKGQLWGLGPDKTGAGAATFLDCPWRGQTDLPARNDVSGWMEMVMPFLKQATGDDAMRLNVFEHMIAARRYEYIDASGKGFGRLASDSPKRIWLAVKNELRKAWRTMGK